MTSLVKSIVLSVCVASSLTFAGCKDEYLYDDTEPSKDMLGSSIYDYLKERGDFTYYTRLIDDLGYQETLSRTGSKTIFAANDAAFERFFQSNPYGVHSYDELTPSVKRELMNSSMINMAYLAEMLSNVSGSTGAIAGRAIRRSTSGSMLDKVTHVEDADLFSYPYWKRFNEKPLYIVADAPMLVHFTAKQMDVMGMTTDDFSLMVEGATFSGDDIYVNGIRVIRRDVICKNGYIHELEDVLLPAGTMADAIAEASDASLFNHLLNRFSAPYFDLSTSNKVKEFYNGSTPLRPSIGSVDSIFTRHFFNERNCSSGPNGESLSAYGMLYYDPSETTYSQASSEEDMGVMFVPTDEALNDYFNGPRGSYLRDAYGSWDNVPSSIMALFLKNHQKRSFSASLPHSWSTLTDETSYPIDVMPENVVHSKVTGNGVVYFVNTVFPPIDYQGVYASVLTAADTKIMRWAITDDWNNLSDTQAMRYYMYLRSMENMYNLLVPTDEALAKYRDPISWARGGANRELWKFIYDESSETVKAEVYSCDASGNAGELRRTVTSKSVIRNRLRDILDLHIVVGDNTDGTLSGYIDEGTSAYVLTKGGGTILTSGTGDRLRVNGAGDSQLGAPAATVITGSNGEPCRYSSDNGRTFFIDHLLHDATINVYDQLSSQPEYKAFLELCQGNEKVMTLFQNDKDIEEIFSTKTTTSSTGIGNIVSFFNNFRYTILVPTADALNAAFAADSKLCTWDEIERDDDLASKKRKTLYLLKFLKFHFIDNSAFITGVPYGPLTYETAARNDYDKFHKVTIQSDGRTLTIRGVDNTDAGNVAHVITTPGLYNVMARDLIVDDPDASKANNIVASSRAVIHLVDKALRFD